MNKLNSILKGNDRDADLLCRIANFITEQRWHVDELESGEKVLRKQV